ncbi:hypothetical protein [Streptomyces sp. OE57]|uniref:hypothetical protein n=1 Tax=Streptomyces lacaronensis TaxID=3379885 RepID=UPI0039B732EF
MTEPRRPWSKSRQAATKRALRRAAANVDFHVTSRVAATDMANGIRDNRIDHTTHEIEIFCKNGQSKTPNQVAAGAVPDTSHHPLPGDGDRQALQADWHGIAPHTHPDAIAALEIATGREATVEEVTGQADAVRVPLPLVVARVLLTERAQRRPHPRVGHRLVRQLL